MQTTTRRPFRHLLDAIRQAVIAAQAERLNVPGFLTPAWRATYCKPR